MTAHKKKKEFLLQELINKAKTRNIEVRTEKLLREVGYRVRSGRCRFNGRDLVLIDRDTPLGDQIEFLSSVLGENRPKS